MVSRPEIGMFVCKDHDRQAVRLANFPLTALEAAINHLDFQRKRKNYFVVWSHPSALCPARKLLTPWFGMEARSPPGVARALHLQGSLQYIISTENINTIGDLFLASVQEIPPCVKNLQHEDPNWAQPGEHCPVGPDVVVGGGGGGPPPVWKNLVVI